METTRKKLIHQLVFIGPAVFFFALILVIPFIMSIYYSFTAWNGVSTKVSWIGIANYKRILFHDTDYYQSLLVHLPLCHYRRFLHQSRRVSLSVDAYSSIKAA